MPWSRFLQIPTDGAVLNSPLAWSPRPLAADLLMHETAMSSFKRHKGGATCVTPQTLSRIPGVLLTHLRRGLSSGAAQNREHVRSVIVSSLAMPASF